MPLTVYLMGESRGVPLSYLHVELHPFVYDYFGVRADLDARIAQAVDEAGGRAFVTLYANPQSFAWSNDLAPDPDTLSEMDALSWVTSITGASWYPTLEMLAVLRTYAPAPASLGENAFYGCPVCFKEEWVALDFDAPAATAALMEQVVEPWTDVEAFLAPVTHVTRLQTALSPREMTVDPVFGFNADLPMGTDTVRLGRLAIRCDHPLQTEPEGDRAFEVDGYIIPVPTQGEVPSLAELDALLLREVENTALRVEQLSESGLGDVLVDHSDSLLTLDLSRGRGGADSGLAIDAAQACGCRHGSGGILMAMGLVPLALRRRRDATRA